MQKSARWIIVMAIPTLICIAMIAQILLRPEPERIHIPRRDPDLEILPPCARDLVARVQKAHPVSGVWVDDGKVISLTFDFMRLEGDDWACLREFPHLRSLVASGPIVDDASFPHLTAVTGLQLLNIGGYLVTDAGTRSIVRLQDLETLILSNSQITDTTVRRLTSLPRLQLLKLSNIPGITDASVDSLIAIPALRELWIVDDTGITSAGLDEIRRNRPDLIVNPSEPPQDL